MYTSKKIESKKLDTATGNKLSLVLMIFGGTCIVLSLFIFFLTFSSVIKEEIKYAFLPPAKDTEIVIEQKPVKKNQTDEEKNNPPKTFITPVDPYFSIVIPKIGANSKVIENVDPNNEQEYQWQLSKGVAHAKGTALPGSPGNSFLFAHSAGDFYEANQYNAVFYLLNKLEKGDKIYTVYYKQKYTYKVTDIKVVDPSEVKYLKNTSKKPILTLMTCTPAGTTINRLIITAELVE